MEILENRQLWEQQYQADWVAHLRATGATDWKRYPSPRNRLVPAGKGIDLSVSRLMLISSAGGFLRDSQPAFDAPNPLGDYGIRTFPAATPFREIAFAHGHYDHAMVEQDPQVLLPLRLLEDLVAEGVIGELAPSVVSFMGYQPDVGRLIDQTIPAILDVACAEQVRGALLVPA